MTQWMIAIEDPNSDEPVFDGPTDLPVWSLYADDRPGPHWGDWKMTRYADDVEYNDALRIAATLGFTGTPIGAKPTATLK